MSNHLSLKHIYITLTCIAMVMLSACRSGKKAADTIDYSGATITQRIEAVASLSGEWSEMQLPVKVDIKQPMSISASGRAYMRRGRDIYVSMRFLGMEVASLYVNSDSVYAQYKIGRVYLAEPIGALLNDASVTVADIQDMLLGRVFVNSQGTINPSMLSALSINEGADSWTITPRDKPAGASYSFRLTNDDNTLQALEVTSGQKTVTCQYADPATTSAGTFMSQARVATSVRDRQIDASLRWSFSSVKWEVDKSVKWRAPSGYRRIGAADLLKILAQ